MAEDPQDAKHQRKEVREALEEILKSGSWRLIKGSHWGRLRCAEGCCDIHVDGTPEVAAHHAAWLKRETRKCPKPKDHPRNRKRS
jgi:hypothetical protein